MDNNVCKIGHFLPFQGRVTYSKHRENQHHVQQCRSDNNSDKNHCICNIAPRGPEISNALRSE